LNYQRGDYTWTLYDGQYKNQFDYILGRRRWRSAFQSVKTRSDADCWSDHELLTATIKIKLKRTQQAKKAGNWTETIYLKNAKTKLNRNLPQ